MNREREKVKDRGRVRERELERQKKSRQKKIEIDREIERERGTKTVRQANKGRKERVRPIYPRSQLERSPHLSPNTNSKVEKDIYNIEIKIRWKDNFKDKSDENKFYNTSQKK